MKTFVKLTKLVPGDQVGVISPSADLAGRFPWTQDLGLQRLKENFGLLPIEYPTTRGLNNSLSDRARDIMAAFADKNNKAVIASIGGEDQIQLIKLLDKQVFLDNPKPFFGFSDNTHLSNFLWNLGIPSYYGGCIMTQFAMPQKMHDFTVEYLRHAFFDTGEYELKHAEIYNDVTNDWADKSSLDTPRLMEPNAAWLWDGARDVEGVLWGGCLESMVAQAASSIFLPSPEDLAGTVLFVETADGNTDHWVVDYVLTGFGERGWLDQFRAILVGRPKAWELNLHRSAEEKAAYTHEQQKVVIETVRRYNKDIPIIQNLDFGHTDPQIVIPNGSKVRISAVDKKIYLTY